MAEKIEGLSIELDLETMKVNSGLEDLNRKMKLVNSEMKVNMSAFDRSEKSVHKYETRIHGLNKKLEVQRAVVDRAQKSYEKMVKEHGEGSEEAEKAATEYNKQAASLQNLERYVEGVTKDLEEFQKEQRIANSNWTKFGENLENAGDKMKTFGKGMTSIGKDYSMKVTAPIVAGGAAIFKAAMDYESAFAGVAKTFSGTDEQLADLRIGIREMAKEIPASTTEIAAVAEAAGQLGIEAESIEEFTRTMIDLGEATNMTAETAATEFARFANITQMSQKDFDRMGSSIVALGNSMATTESEISSMSMRLAAQGSQVGMSESQILALAASMSSLGIESEAGGTAMTTVLKKIDKAVGESGEELAGFAKAAGVSSKDFAKAWNKDPIKALDMFIKGLGESGEEGKNLSSILSDLGIKGIRESDTILRLAGASDLLSDAVETSSDAWEKNSALSDEASQRYETTESKIKILWNRVKDMAIVTGEALVPAVMDLLDAAEPLIRKIEEGAQAFADMSEEEQRTILKTIALVAALGPAMIGIGHVSTGIGGLLTVSGKLSKAIGVASGTGTAGKLALLGKAGVAGLAIAGIAGITLKVIELMDENKKLDEVNLDVAQSLNDQAVELEKNVETFDRLSEKASISNNELARLNDLNKRISESSNPGEIEELQKQYDQLAKKSGLSKDELNELFTANDNIIKQAPDVQTTISETGNAWLENTDAVNEYINSLYEASRIELEAERAKQLENEKAIREELAKLQEQENKKKQELQYLLDGQKMTQDEIWSRQEEINDLYYNGNLSEKEKAELMREHGALQAILTGEIGEEIQKRQDSLDETQASIEKEQERLDKIIALDENMANIILKQVGINEEGAKGLEQLDAALVKNAEEIAALEQKREKNGELTEEEQKRYEALIETNAKQQEAKDYLFEELGVYKDINSLLEGKLTQLSDEEQQRIKNLAKTTEIKVEEGNIVSQIEKKNEKLLEERANLEENRKKQGANKAEIDKQIGAIDKKIGRNDTVLEKILKEAGLWDDVKDSVNLGSTAIENQGGKIDKNNTKTSKGIELEKERTKEAGKDVDKNVLVTDNGTIKLLEEDAVFPVSKLVKLHAGDTLKTLNEKASSPVTKVISFIGKGLEKLKFWEKGTPPQGHPGGPAVVGEKGRELISLPSGKMFLSPGTDTLLNLPKGTHVVPNRETERLLMSTPKYADGTSNWQRFLDPITARQNEFMTLLALVGRDTESTVGIEGRSNQSQQRNYTKDLLEATLQQNKLLMQLLQKDTNPIIDARSLGRGLEPIITETQNRNRKVRDSFA